MSEEGYLTIRQAAKELGLHWRTLWNWTVLRKIPFFQLRPGCKILIPQKEIMRLKSKFDNP